MGSPSPRRRTGKKQRRWTETLDLAGQESSRALDSRLRHYSQSRLLCIDELGYLFYDNRNADLLFQVVSRRYEHKSIVLTTNLAFSDWPIIFPNATCATALIARNGDF